jgi:putative ABC transport system permease protein
MPLQVPHASQLIVKVAFRNVRRNWRHSIAALATLAVGFLALALFQGYIEAFLRSQLDVIYSRIMIGEVMVQKQGSGKREARIHPEKYWISESEQKFLDRWVAEHRAAVKTNVRTLLLIGMAHMGGSSAQVIVWGHDIPEGQIARRKWAWNTWAGHPLRETEPSGTILALGLAEILGCSVTSEEPVLDPVTAAPRPIERPFQCKQPSLMLTVTSGRGRTNALEADVVGLTRAGSRDFDEHLLWVPIRFAQDLASTRGVSQYMIVLNRPSEGPKLRAELRAALAQAGIQLEVVDWIDTEGADLLRRGIDLLTVFRGLVFIVILVIAGAAVLTTMMKTVRERTREIGTLRSLGYLRRHILALFAVESAMLAILAGCIGLVSSVAVTFAINTATITYKGGLLADAIPLRVGYSYAAYAWGFVFLSVVAVLAALLAASGVTRLRIADALSDG